jgi:eukaryotic-like serine/threonine-protein kinase
LVIEKGALVAGRYRLIEQVGSGAMGVVWKAQDERLGRTVAIKRLIVRYALSEGMTEETRKRAMREARIAARLQHRNAIALFDVAEHDGDPILVMEFLPSKSLSVVLEERGTITPTEAAEIGAQVADALAAAHAVGIAHRDVKPGNILLSDNGTVKITDFGISRALDDGTVTTSTSMLAGTPAYLAPEIARGDDPTRASDVFSLGSTLYHAIEGRPPFGTNTNPLALLHAVASGKVPPPRNAGSLAPTLMSLMRVDPTERPSMAEAATAFATASTVEIAQPRTPVRTAPKTPPQPVVPVLATPPQPSPALQTTALPKPVRERSATPRRNLVIVGAVALLVLAGTLLTVLALSNDGGGDGTRQAGPADTGGSSTQQEQPQGTGSEQEKPTTSAPDDAAQVKPDTGVQIGFTNAGQFVLDYYGNLPDPAGRWAKLSAYAKSLYGSEQEFQEYWSQFTNLSSGNAYGVTKNADGSVNVPVDVTYTTASGPKQEKRTVRVTVINGAMLIDSEAK